jgi:hypothetical protein
MAPIDQTAAPRVDPITPPYPPEMQAVFDKIMPPGVPPLSLFTTLAGRVFCSAATRVRLLRSRGDELVDSSPSASAAITPMFVIAEG